MKRITALACVVLVLTSCSVKSKDALSASASSSMHSSVQSAMQESNEHKPIMLYGERHSDKDILDKELEIWKNYYDNDGRRHLFVELPYYSAEFLNLWMQEDSNLILDELFKDFEGTAGGTIVSKNFYIKIKEQCPETIFHGTDVGHQHETTGKRYKKYLEGNGLTDTEQYELTKQACEQGRKYYEMDDSAYRENIMTENFIREYEKINGEKIMGIYGGAHTLFEAMDYETQSVKSMAAQLREKYGDEIDSVNLSPSGYIDKITEPILTEQITVQGKAYTASLFGEQNNINENIKSAKYWRLENAYGDFKNTQITDEYLPCEQFPVKITENEIYLLEYITVLGESGVIVYRFENKEINGVKVLCALNLNT